MKTEYEYSVIIPVYNHWDLTVECMDSVLKYSTSYDYELLVISNGSTDGTQKVLAEFQSRELLKHLSFYSCTEPIGFGRAVNIGMKIAKGKYLIVLNNDTAILDSSWIDILRKPFDDPNRKVGITGPLLLHSWEARCDFIVFFCAMIKAEMVKEMNYLSEDFGWGYGEDIDFSKRLILKGYCPVAVPEGGRLESGKDVWSGSFPIYHKGEATVGELSNWVKITEENRKKLTQIYGV